MVLSPRHNSESSETAESRVDYSDPYNWLYRPEISKEVDIFYVYPTVSSNETGSMPISDEGDRTLAQGFSATEASVYEPYGNVFTP